MSKELRRRREREQLLEAEENEARKANSRSCSVDRLYAIRREHIRYAQGADTAAAEIVAAAAANAHVNTNQISFTTDDIQDIYMPSAIDNYKRKIAVELERRRSGHCQHPAHNLQRRAERSVVLDDLDLFMIKKRGGRCELLTYDCNNSNHNQMVVKKFQPVIHHHPLQQQLQQQFHFQQEQREYLSQQQRRVVEEESQEQTVLHSLLNQQSSTHILFNQPKRPILKHVIQQTVSAPIMQHKPAPPHSLNQVCDFFFIYSWENQR